MISIHFLKELVERIAKDRIIFPYVIIFPGGGGGIILLILKSFLVIYDVLILLVTLGALEGQQLLFLNLTFFLSIAHVVHVPLKSLFLCLAQNVRSAEVRTPTGSSGGSLLFVIFSNCATNSPSVSSWLPLNKFKM